ncbi:MAG: uracil phosphoribosyltransferase [Deltaproteobacteria bacterium]|nr:uracil phosphoribosyltransferase [Deltaproteobacteria bacterium]
MKDSQYFSSPYKLHEIEHKYGSHVHILNEPYLSRILATFCEASTKQPLVSNLVKILYSHLLLFLIGMEFPQKKTSIKTRMSPTHKEAEFEAHLIDNDVPVVTCAIARAGILPSQVCFETLNSFFNAEKIRQDYVYLARSVNDKQEVIGTNTSGHKIGGSIQDAYILIPDPMGATGGTAAKAINLYKNEAQGTPAKIILVHLIITPEYLKHVTRHFPHVSIYALRLDRGLSSQRALQSHPGEYWEEEKGLNAQDYIVPGAGGIGEVLNNSYV